MPTPSHRRQIAAFLRTLDRGDFIALQPSRGRITQSAGHEDAAEVAAKRGLRSPSYVFWHDQSERAFDTTGALVSDLMLHWGGDHARVARELSACPPPFEIVDNGERGAFAVRLPRGAAEGVDDAAVQRRLGLLYTEFAADRAATLQWLHEVVGSSHGSGVRRKALWTLVHEKDAHPNELERFAANLEAEVASSGEKDDVDLLQSLVDILGALRATGSPTYAGVREGIAKRKRKVVYRALDTELAGAEPWSEANEALLRARTTDAHWRVALAARHGLVQCLVNRDGDDRDDVALRLAEDPSLDPALRDAMLDMGCGAVTARSRGCLKVAEDTTRSVSLRGRALSRACGYLQYDRDPAGLGRVDSLLAAGLVLTEEGRVALEQARKWTPR